MRATLRSVFRVNRANLVGAFIIVALATALLTATGSWLQAGLSADEGDSGLALLSMLAGSFAGTTAIIAIFIVASTFATALRRRRREFALLRSIGATGTQVRNQVTGEVLVVVLAAAPIGALGGVLLAPTLTPLLVSSGIVPAGFVLPFSSLAILITLAVLLPSALLAGRLAARESAKLSPTAAVQQSDVEPAAISRGRRIAAAITAVAGLAAATTPLFFSGVLGAASGTGSVLLLIVAAALAGPVVISWLATRVVKATTSGSQAAVVLAAVNARGFSRRNTAVILPLGLLLCLGAVQSGVGIASSAATGVQLEEAVAADLVVSPSDGGVAPDVRTISDLPGVTATAQTSSIQASVRVEDPDEDDFLVVDGLSWESTAIRTVTPANSGLLDPGVVQGSLDDLAEGTIAVSSDALVFTGKGIGDSIGLRLNGDEDGTAQIVAIYENSLGIGDYLLSSSDAAFDPASTTVLVNTESGSAPAVQAALEADGALVTDAHGYAEAAKTASGAEQALSTTLLLALLAFIAIAALQSLATITSGRRAEFELLRRTGATRSQIAAMITVESVFVALAALALGIAAALPALLGIGFGLVGNPLAAFDPIIFGALAAVVGVLPMATMISVGWRSMTPPARSGEVLAA